VVYNLFEIGRRLQGDGNKNWEVLGGTQQFLKIIEMGIDSGARAGKLYISIRELFLGSTCLSKLDKVPGNGRTCMQRSRGSE
jgi:hypothetical protein